MGIRYTYSETFFETWSQEMAYVLGYIYADGSLEDSPSFRGKYLRITSTDHDRVLKIKMLLNSGHTIVKEERGGNHKPRYLLRIGSRNLFEQLARIGLTPRKSHSMLFPLVPGKYLSSFIRGYFDGDGGVYIELRPNGKLKKLRVIFTSGSKTFLQHLHDIFRSRAKVMGTGLYKHSSTEGAFQLRYSSADSIQVYRFMYANPLPRGLYMKRKYDIFSRYFRLRAAVSRPRLNVRGLVAKKSTRRSAKLICEGANPSQASREV